MKKASVYRMGVLAGILTEENPTSFIFKYDDSYFNDPNSFAISLTLPKTKQEYKSEFLFPFFSNMIAEGANLAVQIRYLKIDERDVLGLLCQTANTDSIGAITLSLIEQE